MNAPTPEQQRVDLAVALSRLGDIATDVGAMRTELSNLQQSFVPRTEWTQRNSTVDERHQTHGREIGAERGERQRGDDALRAEFRAELAARRVPWTAVGALVLSALAIAVPLVRALP